jgi:hypothetical protein
MRSIALRRFRVTKYPAARPPTSRLPLPAGAGGLGSAYGYREAVTSELNRLTKMGILEQRIRVLWNKDLARLEALVRDVGGE